jgi:hypothetical protein
MGDDFYAIIKLVSGEEILSLIMIDENDGDPVIVLQNPITMKTFHNSQGTIIKIKPWMEIPDDDFFIIKLDKIITMTETTDQKIINLYSNYIESGSMSEPFQSEGYTKPSPKMGYISSVEEARKNLEKIFKSLEES